MWNINYNQLEMQQELGRGAYGVVYKARYRNQEVAGKFSRILKSFIRIIHSFSEKNPWRIDGKTNQKFR